MPQFHPLPTLEQTAFSLVVSPAPEGFPAPTLRQWTDWLGTVPPELPIHQVITASGLKQQGHHPVLPGSGFQPEFLDIEDPEKLGPWLGHAIALSRCPRILVVDGRGPLPDPGLLAEMERQLRKAHLVLAPRPQSGWSWPGLAVYQMVQWLGGVLLALEPGRQPRWPGWSGWFRRLSVRWVMGAPGNDPETPIRAMRSEWVGALNLQSAGEFAWAEMLAKATFLGVLIEELPTPCLAAGPGKLASGAPGRGWWRDFREVASRPKFGSPWSPPAPCGLEPWAESPECPV